MRVFVLLGVLLITGCSSSPYERARVPNILVLEDHTRHGLRDHDPCVRCGEGWIFLNLDDTAHLKK